MCDRQTAGLQSKLLKSPYDAIKSFHLRVVGGIVWWRMAGCNELVMQIRLQSQDMNEAARSLWTYRGSPNTANIWLKHLLTVAGLWNQSKFDQMGGRLLSSDHLRVYWNMAWLPPRPFNYCKPAFHPAKQTVSSFVSHNDEDAGFQDDSLSCNSCKDGDCWTDAQVLLLRQSAATFNLPGRYFMWYRSEAISSRQFSILLFFTLVLGRVLIMNATDRWSVTTVKSWRTKKRFPSLIASMIAVASFSTRA